MGGEQRQVADEQDARSAGGPRRAIAWRTMAAPSPRLRQAASTDSGPRKMMLRSPSDTSDWRTEPTSSPPSKATTPRSGRGIEASRTA